MAEREKSISQTALAALYEVEARTIRNWVAAGMPERRESGRPAYRLSEVIPWRRAQDKRELDEAKAPDLAAEQARKTKADADLSELKVQQMRGELVPTALFEQQLERTCGVLRARILAMRGRHAARVLGLTSMSEATSALDVIANDLLAALRDGGDELDDDEPTEEAA